MQRRRGRMLAQGLGLAAAFGVLIALPQTAAEGVRSGLTLCGQVILPSLLSTENAAVESAIILPGDGTHPEAFLP